MIHDLGTNPIGGSFTGNHIGNGLIGSMPMEIPLVNNVVPTYISETSQYDYSINKTGLFKDISTEMRWEKSSFAKKDSVGIRIDETDSNMPTFYCGNRYRCDNTFSTSMIINKHGNYANSYSGTAKISFQFELGDFTITSSDTSVSYTYRDSISYTLPKECQIEHLFFTMKRIGRKQCEVKIYDSTATMLNSHIIADIFMESFKINTSGTYQISNTRVYSSEIGIDIVEKICFMGDGKSKIFISDSDFTFGYDWALNRLLSTKISSEKYPYGSNRNINVPSSDVFNVIDRNTGELYDSLFTRVSNTLINVEGMSRDTDQTEYDKSLLNHKIPLIERRPAMYSLSSDGYSFEGTSSHVEYDGYNSSSLFAIPFSLDDIKKVITGNIPVIFGLIHHGYAFVSDIGSLSNEFYKKLSITWDSLSEENKTEISSAIHFRHSGNVLLSNEKILNGTQIYYYNNTGATVTIVQYVYNKNIGAYSTSSIAVNISDTYLIVPLNMTNLYSDMESRLIVIHDYITGDILFSKNIEMYATTEYQSSINILTDPDGTRAFVDISQTEGYSNTSVHTFIQVGNYKYNERKVLSGYSYTVAGLTEIDSLIHNQHTLMRTYEIKPSGAVVDNRCFNVIGGGISSSPISVYNDYCKYTSTNSSIINEESVSYPISENGIYEQNEILSGKISILNKGDDRLIRIVADIRDNVGDIRDEYTIGQTIDSLRLSNLKSIKLNDSKYIYHPPYLSPTENPTIITISPLGVYLGDSAMSLTGIMEDSYSSPSSFLREFLILKKEGKVLSVCSDGASGSGIEADISTLDIIVNANKIIEINESYTMSSGIDNCRTPFVYGLSKQIIKLSSEELSSGYNPGVITSILPFYDNTLTLYGYPRAYANKEYRDILDVYSINKRAGINKYITGNSDALSPNYFDGHLSMMMKAKSDDLSIFLDASTVGETGVFYYDYLESIVNGSDSIIENIPILDYLDNSPYEVYISIRNPITKEHLIKTSYIENQYTELNDISITLSADKYSSVEYDKNTIIDGSFIEFKDTPTKQDSIMRGIYNDIPILFYPDSFTLDSYSSVDNVLNINISPYLVLMPKILKRKDISNDIFFADEYTNAIRKSADCGSMRVSFDTVYDPLTILFEDEDTVYSFQNTNTNRVDSTIRLFGYMKNDYWTNEVELQLLSPRIIPYSDFTIKDPLTNKIPSIKAPLNSVYKIKSMVDETTLPEGSITSISDILSENRAIYRFDSPSIKSWVYYINPKDILLSEPSKENIISVDSMPEDARRIYYDSNSSINFIEPYNISTFSDNYIAYSAPDDSSVSNDIGISIIHQISQNAVSKDISAENKYNIDTNSDVQKNISSPLTYVEAKEIGLVSNTDFHETFDAVDNLMTLEYDSDYFTTKRSAKAFYEYTTRTYTPITGISSNTKLYSSSEINSVHSLKRENVTYQYDPSIEYIYQEEYRAMSYNECRIIELVMILCEDNKYVMVADEVEIPYGSLPSTLYTTSNKVFSIKLYSLNELSEIDITGKYAVPFEFTISIEIIIKAIEDFRIGNNIMKYDIGNTSTSIMEAWKNIGGTYSLIGTSSGGILSITPATLVSASEQFKISSILFKEILPDGGSFGSNVIVKTNEIPFNDVEVFRELGADVDTCLAYYDFYGKHYKKYDKLNLINQCEVIESGINLNRIGLNAKEIIIPTFSKDFRSISFMVQYDYLNLSRSADSIFKMSLIDDSGIYHDIISSQTQFTEISANRKATDWQCVRVLANGNLIDVQIYNETTALWEDISIGIPYNSIGDFKLSIKNMRFKVADLVVSTDSLPEIHLAQINRINTDPSISVVSGTFNAFWSDGDYINYNKDESYDVRKSDVNKIKITNPTPVIYGKFQEVTHRESASDSELILTEKVYSYRNSPKRNKDVSELEYEISSEVKNPSFDIYVQRLGSNFLNNPVIFMRNLTDVREDIPDTYSEIEYIGCLIDDASDFSEEIEVNMKASAYSYNKKLSADFEFDSTNNLAILGKQEVLLKRIMPAVNDKIINGKKYRIVQLDIDTMNNAVGYKQRLFPYHFAGENIRSVYNMSNIVTSYEFSDGVTDGDSDIYKSSRTNGLVELSDNIYKFNKFGNNPNRYIIDKGCAVYLFEGHKDNTILQNTMFIENITTNPKDETISISLKNKLDYIYDKKIINYKTFEDISIKECISQILFPYINVEDSMIKYSASIYSLVSKIPNIKTINLSTYDTIGNVIDDICSCGFNIWIDELERFVIDVDIMSKNIYEGNNSYVSEYDNGKDSMNTKSIIVNGVSVNLYGVSEIDRMDVTNIDDLVDDFVVEEKDGLIVNKIELNHKNLVPMYDRQEYAIGDKIYPINNISLPETNKLIHSDSIVYESDDGAIKPNLLSPKCSAEVFNKAKMKTGVMCVVNRDGYEMQYKFIQAKKESI